MLTEINGSFCKREGRGAAGRSQKGKGRMLLVRAHRHVSRKAFLPSLIELCSHIEMTSSLGFSRGPKVSGSSFSISGHKLPNLEAPDQNFEHLPTKTSFELYRPKRGEELHKLLRSRSCRTIDNPPSHYLLLPGSRATPTTFTHLSILQATSTQTRQSESQ